MTHTAHPFRQHELEYRSELESIQSSLDNLLSASPSLQQTFSPTIERLKRKAVLIEQALQQPTLPPLPDSLRNPLNDPTKIKFVEEVMQKVLGELQADPPQEEDDFWMLN